MTEDKKMAQDQRKSQRISFLLSLLIGGAGGAFIAFILISNDLKFGPRLFIPVLFSLCISILFHIITHEAGHLLFGMLSGYQFVSFRIGSFVLLKKQGKIQINRFNIPGTAGQCLMAPPQMDEEGNYPFKLYNFGGILINFIFSILFTVLAMKLHENPVLWMHMILFAGMGYLMALSNGIPMKISGIANDGYNVFSANKDEVGRRCLYQQLTVNAELSEGKCFGEIPFEIVSVGEMVDFSNPLISSSKLFEYYWYLDQGENQKAQMIFEQFMTEKEKLIPLLSNMVSIEQIYQELMHENREDYIKELLTRQVKTYMKKAKYDIHARRLEYGLALRNDPDSAKTKKLRERFFKVMRDYPVEGEAKFSLKLLKEMETKLANNND